jgi:aminoglycoside/choline kinase family phosphotransferase
MARMGEANSKQSVIRDQRLESAREWVLAVLKLEDAKLTPVSGDASHRRYFRIRTEKKSLILMDAPPHRENSAPFLDIAERIRTAKLHAPEVIIFDLELGFGLLEDLGDTLYRELLDETTVDQLFPALFRILAEMAKNVESSGLPAYDERLMQQEMDLFTHWYLGRHKKSPFNSGERKLWGEVCSRLKGSAIEQPQVFVHKDFHSCNLLQLPTGEPGIIDFQDGVIGPISYDFISLIWDRYHHWPRERLEAWMCQYLDLLGLGTEKDIWMRWCDWMGLQRNLKVVGIFARLHYRDGKDGYLEMIPRFYRYLLDVLSRYPEFREFHLLLERAECAP